EIAVQLLPGAALRSRWIIEKFGGARRVSAGDSLLQPRTRRSELQWKPTAPERRSGPQRGGHHAQDDSPGGNAPRAPHRMYERLPRDAGRRRVSELGGGEVAARVSRATGVAMA